MRHRNKGTVIGGGPHQDVSRSQVRQQLTLADQLVEPCGKAIKQGGPREEGSRLRCRPLRVMSHSELSSTALSVIAPTLVEPISCRAARAPGRASQKSFEPTVTSKQAPTQLAPASRAVTESRNGGPPKYRHKIRAVRPAQKSRCPRPSRKS